MTFSKQWLVLICVVSVVSAVIEAAVPKAKIKKAFGFLSASVMIYALMLPLINGNLPEFDFENFSGEKEAVSQSFENSSLETMLKASKAGYEKVIKDCLFENGLNAEKIIVSCEEKNGDILVSKVEIYGRFSDNQRLSARAIVINLCSDKTEILFFGSEEGD